MIKMVKVTELKPLDDVRLWVRFSDGTEGIRDYSDMLAEGGPMVEPLRDPSFFKSVFVSFGVPSWPNGFEVDAIALHMELEKAGLLIGSVAA
jgi:hypothetical protein